MNVFKMAWRNVWRNKRRSLVTIGAMTLALFTMVQYSGLFDGYIKGMERNILDLEMGDIQIFPPGYRDQPSIYKTINNPVALMEKLEREFPGLKATGRLTGSGLAAAGNSSAGIMLKGIHMKRDAKVSKIGEQIFVGSWLIPGQPDGVVIGKRLAHSLSVGPGDEIVVLSQAADGSMANELYTVLGVLKYVGNAVDRTGVFMLDEAFRELMAVDKGVHQIIVRTNSTEPVDTTAANITPLAEGLDVNSWRKLAPNLATMLESSRGAMFVMFLIIYIAIGVVVLNTMLMAVFERIREFGVLKALGQSPMSVLTLIVLESAMQTTIAVIAGGLLSVPAGLYLSAKGLDLGEMGGFTIQGIAWDPIWYASYTSQTVAGPLFTLIFIVSMAVIYPALKAALIKPVAAIHHR